MRIILFFDLPAVTDKDKREYTVFRKFLVKTGFIMMQESVYSKLTLNNTTADLIKDKVRKNKPIDGVVQMITITEKQFSKMEFIVGKSSSNIIDNDKKLVIL